MDLRALATPSTAARAGVRLIGQGPGPAYAGYEVPLGEIDTKISAALALSGYSTKLTWPELAAVVGTPNAWAIIPLHVGTHVDPVTGATVQNTGVYKWSISPAGWERKFDTQALAAQNAAADAEAVLSDANFVLVAGDLALAGASKIGTVSTNIAAVTTIATNIANVNAVAGALGNIGTLASIAAAIVTVAGNISAVNTVATDLNLGGASLLGQGPAVIAAIASALAIVPAYVNAGGTGARTSVITVTASAGLINASYFPDRLVNGSTSGNTTAAAIVFNNAVSTVGAYLRFDFGFGAKKVITEAKWYQTASQTHGTWQWKGSNDAVSWTNIGATFTLGGSATQTQNTLGANVVPYRYYQLELVSGSTSSGPFIYEVEFKIAGSYTDALVGLPLPIMPNAVAAADESGNLKWRPVLSLPATAAPASGANRLFDVRFHEGSGTIARDWRTGAVVFDFGATHQATYGAPPIWTPRGLRFRQNMIRTESFTNVRTIARLVRLKRDETTKYDLSVSAAGEPIFSQGSSFNGNSTIRIVTPEGTLTQHYADVSGASGSSSHRRNRGGWFIEFIQASAQFTGRVGLGGHPTGTVASARIDDMECRAIVAWDGVLTDAECLAEAAALFRPLGASCGAYAVVDDCPIIIKGAAALGQSMIVGDPLLSDLEAWKKSALAYVDDLWFWAAAKGTAGPPVYNFARSVVAARLRVGGNNWPDDMPHAAEHFGIEVGWTLAKQEGFNTGVEEALFKGGLNGTFLAGPTEGIGGNSMHPAFPKSNGWFWYLMKELDTFQQYMMRRGIGIRWKSVLFDQGQQECNSANPAAYSLARQQNMQDFWDTLKLHLGSPPGIHMVVSPIHPNAAPTAYSSTYIANVNNGITAFDAANSDVSTIVVSDLVLTPASTTVSRTVDGITYPPITPLEQADSLHYPVIDQQVHDRRFRAAAVAAGF